MGGGGGGQITSSAHAAAPSLRVARLGLDVMAGVPAAGSGLPGKWPDCDVRTVSLWERAAGSAPTLQRLVYCELWLAGVSWLAACQQHASISRASKNDTYTECCMLAGLEHACGGARCRLAR